MRSLSIKKKFLIGTLGLVIGFGLVTLLLVRTVLFQSLYVNLEKRGEFFARKLAQDAVTAILTEEYYELQMLVNDAKQLEDDIVYVFVRNDRGEVLAHTFGQTFPEDLRSLDATSVEHSSTIHRLETGRGMILDFCVPFFEGPGGRVHVGMAEAPIWREVNATIGLLIGGVVALMVLGGALAAILALSITKPISVLADAVDSMKRGDMGARVTVFSDDEVGHLAAAFNSMAASREQVEAALLLSERKLRDITSSLGEGILVTDREGRLTFMNPEAERLLGWREEELAGKPVHDIMHFRKPDGSPYPAAECPSMNVARSGERIHIDDDIYIRKDGSEISVAYISAPILEAGKVVAVVIVFRDISQQKQREAEREMMIIEHMDALSKVKVLSGMLPICASCKKIRDDSGYWKQIESYIHEHSEAEFSHGICPDCAVKLYPGQFQKNS